MQHPLKQFCVHKTQRILPLINELQGSLAEAFRRYRETPEWTGKAVRTREEWMRAWARIGPTFGDVAPSAVQLDHISKFREKVEREVSRREAHRCLKVWRSLWKVAAAMHYCKLDADPSKGVRNREPERRQALWTHREAIALVKDVWRAEFLGLAAIIAVAWDTSFSPVDVRKLMPSQRARDGRGEFFSVAPAPRERCQGPPVASWTPIFRGSALRLRQLQDFRRSGAVEALRGGASKEEIGNKLANDFSSSANLQKTYAPGDLAIVRMARKRGRK